MHLAQEPPAVLWPLPAPFCPTRLSPVIDGNQPHPASFSNGLCSGLGLESAVASSNMASLTHLCPGRGPFISTLLRPLNLRISSTETALLL